MYKRQAHGISTEIDSKCIANFTGLVLHAFHGNCFIRSTDLLSLPNVNPDLGFSIQLAIEESLKDIPYACFQAALLYTNSKGRVFSYKTSKSSKEFSNGLLLKHAVSLPLK